MTADSELAADLRAGSPRQRLGLLPRATGTADPAPPVRLRREWKGALLADLARDRGGLPGRVVTSVEPVGGGNALLPRCGALLVGPGALRHRAGRRRRALAVGLVVLLVFLGCCWP